MLKKVLNRLQNIKVITAVVSGILLILVNTGVIDIDMSNSIMDTVNIILGLLVTIGVFGDPESHIQDKKEENAG